MAKLKFNNGIATLHGRVGDVIYRTINGQVYASRVPRPSRQKPTVEQVAHRQRFTLATDYARAAMADPQLRQHYERLAREVNKPAYALAVAEFFHPPVLREVDLSDYHGRFGDPIVVRASEGAVSVTVTVYAPCGTVIEHGEAQPHTNDWLYLATSDVGNGQQLTIEAAALDRVRHVGTRTVPWP